jgi:hypothetical protein
MPKVNIYMIPELEAIPDRTPRRAWTEWEENVLRNYYGRKPDEAIARVLKRTGHAVREKARNLGLKLYQEEE